MSANVIQGRVPSHNTDAEVALLGSILFKNSVLDEVQSMLEKTDFYVRGHQLIWEAMLGLRNEKPGMTLDLLLLTQYMQEKKTLAEAGGAAYLASLTNSVPTYTNALYYAELIKNASTRRKLFDISVLTAEKAYDESEEIEASIDAIDEKVTALSLRSSTTTYSDVSNLIQNVVDNVHDIMAGKQSIGISSGFRILDHYIGAFKPSDFIIIAARPSVGKTALALSIAVNMAFGNNPVPIGFFSLEMSGASLVERVLANKGQVNLMSLRNGKLDREANARMMEAASALYNNAENLLVQDTPNIKISEIRAQARKMVRDNGVKVIFIDYIGLIECSGENKNRARYEQVMEISRSLKQLARELSIPVICLCQVSREAGKDRGPILADLRDSGSIEQDADLVILLDDPSKRLDDSGKAKYEEEEGEQATGKAKPLKIIIAKQRNGNTGAFNLNFVADYASFREIEKF
ncbi:MAG: replicative DNA helicase [Spirochaetales bacterium]|nr:replicative DNA helicase [Spirochaetales bacterium]